MRSSVHRLLILVTTLLATITPHAQSAGVVSEYWAQQNQDGSWRNSNATPVSGTLRLRWARALTNLTPMSAYAGNPGQRFNNLAIRNGRIMVMNGALQMYALRDGAMLQSLPDPGLGGGGMQTSYGPLMDSDMQGGLINVYWRRDGVVFTGNGGDYSRFMMFRSDNGEVPTDVNVSTMAGTAPNAGFWFMSSPNQSGCFAMTDSSLAYSVGGGGGHDSWEPPSSQGLLGISHNRFGDAMKHYCSFVVDGDWIYDFNMTNRARFSGVVLSAHSLSDATRNWIHSAPNKGMLSHGVNHAQGAQRALALGEDGRLYYYGYWTQAATGAPDFQRGMVLTGVPAGASGSTRNADLEVTFSVPEYVVPAPAPLRPEDLAFAIAQKLYPQIATRGRYVVIFQPFQSMGETTAQARIFAIDTTTRTLLWSYLWPAGTMGTNTSLGTSGYSPEQAVQLVIAGAEAFVVEPRNIGNALTLNVDRFDLATGARSRDSIPTSAVIPTSSGAASPAVLRDLAAVDGTLVALVDFGAPGNVRSQGLVVLDGAATPARNFVPVAVMSGPQLNNPPVYQTTSTVIAPHFAAGYPIAFSAEGSYDPDGGALTYQWDFGDGDTSTAIAPVHTYTQNVPRTVSLRVIDPTGNASPILRRVVNLAAEPQAIVNQPVPPPPAPTTPNSIPGLVAHWPLDEGTGTKTSDVAGNTQQADLQGFAAPATAGSGWVTGGALAFDGADDRVMLPREALTAIGPRAWTMSFRVYRRYSTRDDSGIEQMVLGQANGVQNGSCRIYFWGNAVGVNRSGGGYIMLGGTVSPFQWHRVTIVRDPTTTAPGPVGQPNIGKNAVYVDGVLQPLGINRDRLADCDAYTSAQLLGGAPGSNPPGGLGPLLDDVRIYNRALTAAEVSSMEVVSPVTNQPPTVTLEIAAGTPTTFTAPAAVSLKANPSDPEGRITKVDFYVGTALIGSSGAAPYSITWTNAQAGTYSLTAIVTDDRGASGVSPPLNVSVGSSSTAPITPTPTSQTFSLTIRDRDGRILLLPTGTTITVVAQ